MRAKMSLPNHGTSDCAMRPGCCGHPSDAFDEARAILAETESKCVPDRPSMFPQDRAICCAANEATDALAESLRSFLEA